MHSIESMLSTSVIQSDLGSNHLTNIVCLIDSDEWTSTDIGQERGEGGGICGWSSDIGVKNISSVMNEIMERSLGKEYMWATRCGLGINPTNTGLISSTSTRSSPHAAK